MQRIIFLSVGRVKNKWIAEGVAQFVERLAPSMRVEHIELQPSSHIDVSKYRDEESKRIVDRMEKMEGDVWLLDEKGKELTSIEFSKILEKSKDEGATLIFVLGGAYGVNDSVKKKAKHILALSKMTFPHEFCQLVFLEQLYRANEIVKGSGYHH